VLPIVPIPRIGGASVRDHYVDSAGPAINPLIKMANIVAIMIISLIAIHG
jgi:Na+/H+-translocating membrane pyrophosphatase